MPVSSIQSYKTAVLDSNTSQTSADAVQAVAFDALFNKTAETSESHNQVRFEFKRAPDSSLYTIIKVNNKSYRISVYKQKHQLSYTKHDWQKIESKVKGLLSVSNSQGSFLKGTLKLRDRTWTPIFSNKTSEPKIEKSTLRDIIEEIKQLFEHEIKPLNALPLSQKQDTHLTSTSHSSPDTQMSSYRKRSLEKEHLDQTTTSKKRKSNSYSNIKENPDLITTGLPVEEKQESIFKKPLNWVYGIKNLVFPQKSPDTLSNLDLTSDTTSIAAEEEQHLDSISELDSDSSSSREGSLSSKDIGGGKTVLDKDLKGFTLR